MNRYQGSPMEAHTAAAEQKSNRNATPGHDGCPLFHSDFHTTISRNKVGKKQLDTVS
jgi:hypothetical protein